MKSEILEVLKSIDKEYEIVKRFMGGMSNFTYLVKNYSGDLYVYRYPGTGNYNFVNYLEEEANLEEIKKLDISNATIYLETNIGIKISKYIKGENIGEDVDLHKVSNILKVLHTSNVKLSSYNHLSRLEKYEKLHGVKNDEYDNLKSIWLDIYNKYLEKHIKYPAHNDAQFANFIQTDNGNIKLLDWEYSGVNDYIYDIACFGNKDFSYAIKLLNVYEKEVDNNKLIRLYSWRMFQCLQWYNVALYKEQIGLSKELEVDFLKVSKNYLVLAQSFLKEVLKAKEDYEKLNNR